MESKEYFEKIMQDYNQNGKGRSLRKYCKDEAVDYNWLIEFRKTYPARSNDREKPASAGFIPLEVEKSKPQQACWQVSQLTLLSPEGQAIEIKNKWFDNGKFLKPEFQEARTSHCISKETLMLLMTSAVQTRLSI